MARRKKKTSRSREAMGWKEENGDEEGVTQRERGGRKIRHNGGKSCG